jgi:cathepsin L
MKVASIIVLLFIVSVVFGISEKEYQVKFTEWIQKYNKVYGHDEFQSRYQIFKKNFDFVRNHDSSVGFTVALNKLGDLSVKEFSRIYNGYNMVENRVRNVITSSKLNISLPETWDWRTRGAVTGVKNQGQCGSCWSFSATGSTEGAHFLKTGRLVSLSEQNLVDCSTAEGNEGCNGGLMDWAFEYIIKNRGIDTESSYPYTATGPNACKFNPANVGATLSSFKDVPTRSESSLQEFVYEAPTSVAIDASHSSFQFYSGGVYYEPNCSPTRLDHGVLAIGWGVYSGQDYWLVKNSWGADWGLNGYIQMSRNRNNNCGIATEASRPIA